MADKKKIGWSDVNWIIKIAIVGGILCVLDFLSAFVVGFIQGWGA